VTTHSHLGPDPAKARPAGRTPPVSSTSGHILIVDDHGLVRHGLSLAVQARYPNMTVHEAGSLGQATRLVRELSDLAAVLYDLQLSDADGMPGLSTMVEAAGSAPVIVVSGAVDARVVAEAIRAGARGVLPKGCGSEVLDQALPIVLSGGLYAPALPAGAVRPCGPAVPQIASGSQPAPALFEELTERQRAVLRLLLDGQSNKEIARSLGVLEGTIKVHLRSIMLKLRVRNRTQLALAAARAGILAAEA